MAKSERLLSSAAWGVAIGLVLLLAILSWHFFTADQTNHAVADRANRISIATADQTGGEETGGPKINLPAPVAAAGMEFVPRLSDLHTIIPNRARRDVIDYTVKQGDSIFEIASRFNITPEAVLWANYDQLKDNPDLISIDMVLHIPPVNGVLYEYQSGDTLEGVAGKFKASISDILDWPGNQLDLTNPDIQPGAMLMIPGGHREFRQWLIPTIPRGAAGVSKSVYGEGACEGSYEGAYGTGTFIWPTELHTLSGNDYWSGHLGIDIAAAQGAPIYASDGGVVVFSGWSTGGYGNTIMIDHGNGYQTLYGHLNSTAAGCGRSVSQGTVIGYAGSTGNSTGTHLHFEVRYQGGFINPWYVLPAP
jgi:murein DD-endopeptidase MepM/ murein hydrolase activator NlpD